MRDLVTFFSKVESTSSHKFKLKSLQDYFSSAHKKDSLWLIAILIGKRPKRPVQTKFLRQWAAEEANIPSWLFEETYHIVGDLAETIAKLIPDTEKRDEKSLSEWIELLQKIRSLPESEKRKAITEAWQSLDVSGRFLFNKLMTGGFRIGISKKMVIKAVANYLELDDAVVAHRLMGNWTPDTITFDELLLSPDPKDSLSKPYPFLLAHQIEEPEQSLKNINEWVAEYKWDGIRGQLIKRSDSIYLWSRGEELIEEQFPEFRVLSNLKVDFVLDGEILVFDRDTIGNFNSLQKRIGKLKPSKNLLSTHPVKLVAYDLLELNGLDLRKESLQNRRAQLEHLIFQLDNDLPVQLSEALEFDSFQQLVKLRDDARRHGAEGLILKHKESEYGVGRYKGAWYKWKLDPYTVDAVMLYAQRGHGRRANLYTDFTFAVKHEGSLVPVAKAYTGLTDAEFLEISSFVNKNTIERYGPVCSVKPELVFEIAFEALSESSRHKSGIAMRFPRILRWRKDKKLDDIDTLDNLKSMIKHA